MAKPIRFTKHAEEKLSRLTKIGVTKEKVIKTIENAEKITQGYLNRKIAQGSLTDKLVLRVVYEEIKDGILVITAYPGEKERYK